MEVIRIEATKRTPEIILDLSNNEFVIKGRSMPEDATGFYEPVIEWLLKYSSKTNLVLNVFLDYFNTSSSKQLLEIFKTIKEANDSNIIKWHYDKDDEDMQEAGEDFIFIIGDFIQLVETRRQ